MHIFCPGSAKTQLRKAVPFQLLPTHYAFLCKKCSPEIVPKISKIHPKSAPKSTKNVSGGTREQPRAPTKQQMDVFLDLFANTGPTIPMILPYFGSKNDEKCDRKNGQKTAPSQNYFFWYFFDFSGVARTILIDFGAQNGSQEGPGATCLRAFPAIGFQHDFCNSFGQKNAKPKKRKSLKIYVFLRKNNDFEGSPDKKKRAPAKNCNKNNRFFAVFWSKNDLKSDSEQQRHRKSTKIASDAVSERTFSAPGAILGDFGVPDGRQIS